ncbi:MAG TPA: hypothetical protein VG433_12955, partial [Pirellulales bacterium]|nr:hypothetical protein [Pirellulales bacterium]
MPLGSRHLLDQAVVMFRFIRWRTLALLLALGCAASLVAPVRGQVPQPGSEPAVSVGDHAALQEIPSRNLFSILRAGGLLMVPILFCSVLMLVFVF